MCGKDCNSREGEATEGWKIIEGIWKKSDLKLGENLAKGKTFQKRLTSRAGSRSRETNLRASKGSIKRKKERRLPTDFG